VATYRRLYQEKRRREGMGLGGRRGGLYRSVRLRLCLRSLLFTADVRLS
jgi:hypothetical protein